MDTKKTKVVNASIVGGMASVVMVILLTIIGELYSPLNNMLKAAHYHHWIGKGVWAAISFVVVALGYGLMVKNSTDEGTSGLLKGLSWLLVFGTSVFILFFVYEFFKH